MLGTWWVSDAGLEEQGVEQLDALLQRGDGFVWVDIPEFDDAAEAVLRDRFHAHPMVVKACRERNFVPSVHGYEDHTFVIVHTPLAGDGGHVHMLELDQLVGSRYLVTVHGPRNPAVSLDDVTQETRTVRERIEAGRFHPRSPSELSYAIGSAVARRQSAAVKSVAGRLPALEMRVMGSDFHQPEQLLEELFLLRHELLISRTQAGQAHEVYGRLASLERFASKEAQRHARDLAEQFDRVRSLADGESQFLFGVIELYQTRVTTKMTVAMERLAVIAAITLPVTAIASIYGMNVIVNNQTHWVQLVIVLVVMLSNSQRRKRWARRKGWL
jgi:Mg2+ and Co2+ transporter CorA